MGQSDMHIPADCRNDYVKVEWECCALKTLASLGGKCRKNRWCSVWFLCNE